MDKLLYDILSYQHLTVANNVMDKKTLKVIYYKNRRNNTFHLPFDDVLTNLEENKVIEDITFDEVVLNKNIINVFKHSSNLEDTLKYLNEVLEQHKPLLECIVCNVILSTRAKLTKHNQTIAHLLRTVYHLKMTSTWFAQDHFALKLFDLRQDESVTEVKANIKEQIEIQVTLINISNEILKISSIIKLNRYMTEMKIQMIEGNPINRDNLIPGGSASFLIRGKFNNSTEFVFPFCLAVNNGIEVKPVLETFNVKISSDWTYLETGVKYVPKPKKFVNLQMDQIIEGESPENTSVNLYKEVIPLHKYPIPKHFEELLINLITDHPNFIKRNLNIDFNFRESAKQLGLPTNLRESNYTHLLMHLLHIEEHQMQVDIKDYNTESTVTPVRGKANMYRLEVPGLAESRPSLVRYDSVYLKENYSDTIKFEGRVHQVLETAVELGFNKKFSDIFVPNKKFFIEFGFNRRPIKVEKQAVTFARGKQMVPYFFPKEVYIIQNNPTQLTFATELNEEQKRAIQNLLTRKTAPYLIFGPPGTGKTVTVVEAILQIHKTQPASKILVCAPSNEAVNEIAIRLLKKIPASEMIRLVGPMYGNVKNAAKRDLADIMNFSKDGTHYMPDMEQLLKYRVVIVTLVTAARLVNGNVPEKHFSYVFIDESGYATETESLIPLAGILSAGNQIFGQLVLAGDPKQLGPILHSNFVKYCGFNKSMLERLIDSCALYARDETKEVPYDEQFVTKLIRNYRSHPDILQVSNDLFYHKELEPVGTMYTHIFVDWEGLRNPKFPVMFHHVEGDDKREENSPSFFNTQEIEEVAHYLEKIVRNRVKGMMIMEEHIGIITPYRKQADKLNKVCQKLKMPKVTVGTVEQFQGKEKLVIIISTVRSKNTHKFEELDKKCQIGFLRNPKRFNVALTRAKALLIVVGNAQVLNADKYWRTFIKFCEDNNSVVGKQFTMPLIDPIEEDQLSAEMAALDISIEDNVAADFSRGNV